MASVRDTIYRCLVCYPELFRTKSECFSYLFLVNGNGYEWIKGELVDKVEDRNKKGPMIIDEEIKIAKTLENLPDFPGDYSSIINNERLRIRRQNASVQFAMENIDLILAERVSFQQGRLGHYSGPDHCQLMKVPDNIKEDWLIAVKECIYGLFSYISCIQRERENEDMFMPRLKTDLHPLCARLGLDKELQWKTTLVTALLDELKKKPS